MSSAEFLRKSSLRKERNTKYLSIGNMNAEMFTFLREDFQEDEEQVGAVV